MIINEGALGDFVKKHIVNYSAVAKEGGKKWQGVKDDAQRKGRASRAKFAKREKRIMGEELTTEGIVMAIRKIIADRKKRKADAKMAKHVRHQTQQRQGINEANVGFTRPFTAKEHPAMTYAKDAVKLKAVSWNPPEVQAKAAKDKKEQKMFDSAKREINRLKARNEEYNVVVNDQDEVYITEAKNGTLNEIMGRRGEFIMTKYRMYQHPDHVEVWKRGMDLRGYSKDSSHADAAAAKKHVKKAVADEIKSYQKITGRKLKWTPGKINAWE